MGTIGALVLLGNGVWVPLLYRHRAEDLNKRSTWLYFRNHVIANLSVLAAAAAVRVFDSAWPDILVGTAIAILFLRSAFTVICESLLELRKLRLLSVIDA